jgi:hypothetical protein
MRQNVKLFSTLKKESFEKKLNQFSNFNDAIQEFKKLSNEKNILEKQKIIKSGCYHILKTNVDQGADLSDSIWPFCIVNANIPNLYSEFKFLFDFSQNVLISSFNRQTVEFCELTKFEIAVEFIYSMNYFIRNQNEEIDKIGTFKERFQTFLEANRNFKEELNILNEILIEIARLIPSLKQNSSKLDSSNSLSCFECFLCKIFYLIHVLEFNCEQWSFFVEYQHDFKRI